MVSMHGDAVATVLDHGDADLGDGEPTRLMNKRNAARILGQISEREVDRRIAAGDLEAVNIGRLRLVVTESLDAYVARLRDAARKAA